MNETEFSLTVERYKDTLFRIAYHWCANRFDAEDAVQNAFIKLYKSSTPFNGEEHMKAWLIRVTVNECKRLLMNPWRKLFASAQDSELEEARIADESGKCELFDAVARLPKNYRVVIHLYYFEDYTVKEIAVILGLSESNVQTRLMRARKKLRQALGEMWEL